MGNTNQELLTAEEHALVDDAGRLYTRITESFGDGKHKEIDLIEIRLHIHAIQHATMANAPARAYPDRYRLRGQAGAHEAK